MEQGIKGYVPAPVAVQDLAEAAAAAMRYTLRINGFELHAEYGDDGAMVLADPVALRQALVNILANAIRYSPGRRDIALRTARDGAEARIAVADHGTGIAAGDLPHLFDWFYRGAAVRQDRGGTGLGLAIVRHVVDAHGGRVEVASEPGSGSTFTIILPILSQQTP
jgi:signal transduction histidine kinase